jgi:type IV pilus assembly protein PilO
MLEYWERILERPKWQRVSGWMAVIGVVSFLSWNFLISDTYTELEESIDKVETLDSQIAIETGRLKNLPILRKELEYYNLMYAKALEMLPRKGQIESLLESVSDLAKDSGLSVKSFTPRAELKRQFFSEIPVDILMKGNFHQMAIFLDEISRISRVVNVQDILIDNPRGAKDAGLVEVDVRAVLKTFRYLEESERPNQDSNKTGEQKK